MSTLHSMTEHSTFISKQPRGQSTRSKKQMLLYRTRIFKEPEGKMRAKKQHPPAMHTYTNPTQKKTVHRWTVISKICYWVRWKNSAQLHMHSPFAGTRLGHLHLLFRLLPEFHAPHFLPSQRERFQTMGPFHMQFRKGKD